MLFSPHLKCCSHLRPFIIPYILTSHTANTVSNSREARMHAASEYARLHKERTGADVDPEVVVKVGNESLCIHVTPYIIVVADRSEGLGRGAYQTCVEEPTSLFFCSFAENQAKEAPRGITFNWCNSIGKKYCIRVLQLKALLSADLSPPCLIQHYTLPLSALANYINCGLVKHAWVVFALDKCTYEVFI